MLFRSEGLILDSYMVPMHHYLDSYRVPMGKGKVREIKKFGYVEKNLRILKFEGELASVDQLEAPSTGDQEVVGLTPTESATFFHGDLIMKYFLRSFSVAQW